MAWTRTISQKLQVPKSMCLWYHRPRYAHADHTVASSIEVFKTFDIVLLGDGVQLPTYSDYGNTRAVITGLRQEKPDIEIFGYVAVGTAPAGEGLDMATIKQRIDAWKAIGATDIFLDECGYDYGVTRDRLNEIIMYIHANSMNVMVNAWDPDDIFTSTNIVSTYNGQTFNGNPNNLPPALKPSDYYMFEALFWDVYNGVQKAGTRQRVREVWYYYHQAQSEYGGQTWYQKFGVKTVAEGGLLTFDQARYDIGFVSALNLRMHAYSIRGGDGTTGVITYSRPKLDLLPTDRNTETIKSSYSGVDGGSYDSTIGTLRLKTLWVSDSTDGQNPDKGIRQAFINDYPVFDYGLARPVFAPKGFRFFDTSINRLIIYTGSGWVDTNGASV